jgi:hypothetical protein
MTFPSEVGLRNRSPGGELSYDHAPDALERPGSCSTERGSVAAETFERSPRRHHEYPD